MFGGFDILTDLVVASVEKINVLEMRNTGWHPEAKIRIYLVKRFVFTFLNAPILNCLPASQIETEIFSRCVSWYQKILSPIYGIITRA